MIKKIILTFIISTLLLNVYAQKSYLKNQGTATQLIVNDNPFLIIGGELGNSSAGCNKDIEDIFPRLQRIGLNTVLVPTYWDLTEPKEGEFDFQLTDKVIAEARKNNLKVVFLWFGAWKNSMSCYAPEWFKKDYKKYPRVHTSTGKPLEIASPFSEDVFKADNRAFSKWIEHIATIDKNIGTVIMIQLENEIGMLENARDYSADANILFSSQVPLKLVNYLLKNKSALHPYLLEKWSKNNYKTKGTWKEIFGDDIYTDEIFMAWYFASYVERLAKTARSIYDIPLYVNAAMNSRGRKPGQYPSAGPLAHLIDIWKCAAPQIDFISPDIYDTGFKDWVGKYKLANNPLFIPETRLEDNCGVRAFYVFGEKDAIGFSPFSIESASENIFQKLSKSYSTLNELMPLITKYQGKGIMSGFLFDNDNKERIITNHGIKITCRHYFTLPWDSRATDGSLWPEGGGILIELNKYEYILAGSGVVAEFADVSESSDTKNLGEDGFEDKGKTSLETRKWNGEKRIGLASVDEIDVDKDCNLKFVKRLNGDQDHQGRHARISVDDYKILHIKLYEYK